MGNHEYCSGCGASDFHSGMSCAEAYPERWAKREEERKAAEAVVAKEKARVDKLVKATVRGGQKAVTARLLEIQEEEKRIEEKQRVLKQKRNELGNESLRLRKVCKHPSKYIHVGFLMTTCDLCGWDDY